MVDLLGTLSTFMTELGKVTAGELLAVLAVFLVVVIAADFVRDKLEK